MKRITLILVVALVALGSVSCAAMASKPHCQAHKVDNHR
jgi:hypothetical protein